MKLVVDTNRVIAALVKDSYSRRVLLSDKFEFFSLAFGRQELDKYRDYVLEKSGLSAEQFDVLVDALFHRVSVLEDSLVESRMLEAKRVMDSVDPKDTPFIAAALAVEADGVWSEDPHFASQTLVKVFRTKDLTALL